MGKRLFARKPEWSLSRFRPPFASVLIQQRWEKKLRDKTNPSGGAAHFYSDFIPGSRCSLAHIMVKSGVLEGGYIHANFFKTRCSSTKWFQVWNLKINAVIRGHCHPMCPAVSCLCRWRADIYHVLSEEKRSTKSLWTNEWINCVDTLENLRIMLSWKAPKRTENNLFSAVLVLFVPTS